MHHITLCQKSVPYPIELKLSQNLYIITISFSSNSVSYSVILVDDITQITLLSHIIFIVVNERTCSSEEPPERSHFLMHNMSVWELVSCFGHREFEDVVWVLQVTWYRCTLRRSELFAVRFFRAFTSGNPSCLLIC